MSDSEWRRLESTITRAVIAALRQYKNPDDAIDAAMIGLHAKQKRDKKKWVDKERRID